MVTIIETDKQRLHSIANLWSDGNEVEIINGQFSTRPDIDSSLMTWWLADNADASVRIIVEDRREAQRFSPNVAPEAIALEAVTYADIEQPRTDGSDLVLSFHADSLSADDITDVVTRLKPTSVLVSRPKTGDTALLYSGTATGEESSTGAARWFNKYKPPWIELDADANADETDDDDSVVTGNGMVALVWKQAPGEEATEYPAVGAFFKKRMNLDGAAVGETFMPLNEVLFRLEHLLVFD